MNQNRTRHCLRNLFVVTALASSPLAAQTIDLTALEMTPHGAITWNYTPAGLSHQIGDFGVIHFQDSVGRDFYTFSIDLLQSISPSSTYAFVTSSPAAAPFNNTGLTLGAAKSTNLSLLFGNVFGSDDPAAYAPLAVLNSAEKKQAFQLAVTELVFDDDFSLTARSGKFFISPGVAPYPSVVRANSWLNAVANASADAAKMPLIAFSNPNFQDQITAFSAQFVPIPEPSVFAAMVGSATLVGVLWLRQRARRRLGF